jgi:hypothetical protein
MIHLSRALGRGLLLAPFLGSCAFRTAHAELRYPPHAPPRPVAVAAALSLPYSVEIGSLEDERVERWVGERRNSWGMHTTTLVTESPVAPWVRSALAQELANKGVRALDAPPGQPAGETGDRAAARWTVTGTVDSVFASEQFFSEGRVSLTAALAHDGKVVFKRRYVGLSSVPRSEGDLDERCSEALARALADALRALASDVRSAIDA